MTFIMRRVELQLNRQDLGIGEQRRDPLLDAIAYVAKERQNFFVVTLCRGRVGQRTVIAREWTAQRGAAFGGIAAKSDQPTDLLHRDLFKTFRFLAGNVDADFLHDADRQRVNALGGGCQR